MPYTRRVYRNTGLGFNPFDASSVLESAAGPMLSGASDIFSTATNAIGGFLNSIGGLIGIGGGRREADQIVPVQNQVHSQVLAPTSAALQQIALLDAMQVQALYNNLVTAEQQWLAFLHNTQWSDGRAATQAEATLAPYFTDFKSRLLAALATFGVTASIANRRAATNVTTGTGGPVLASGIAGMDTTTLVLAGLGLYLISTMRH